MHQMRISMTYFSNDERAEKRIFVKKKKKKKTFFFLAYMYIQRSVYAHSLISYRTYEIDYCSLFLSFHVEGRLRVQVSENKIPVGLQ